MSCVDTPQTAFLFDLDGTLVDSAPEIRTALNAALAPIGIEPFPLSEVQGFVGGGAAVALRRALAARGRDLDDQAFRNVLADFYEVYAEVSKEGNGLYPGVVETLTTLRAHGMPLGVCTNKAAHITSIALEALRMGDALAGGAGLAACCDFIFSTPEARFGYTEVKIGFIPAIVMVFLLRKIGGGKAKELLLTGNLFSSEWAQSIGLINYVADQSKIADEVLAFVTRLIETNSSTAMSMTKEMMIHVQSLSLEDGLSYACEMNAKARGSADCKAGIEAFLNKTKIKW